MVYFVAQVTVIRRLKPKTAVYSGEKQQETLDGYQLFK